MDKRVLIIDDDQVDQMMITKLLGKAGFDRVLTARNGEEGLELARSEKPDLAIVDTLLPGMNGHETCRELKNLKDSKLKVIVTTGAVDAVNAGNARRAGADDYVVKTIDFSCLLDAVRRLMEAP